MIGRSDQKLVVIMDCCSILVDLCEKMHPLSAAIKNVSIE